MPWRIIDGDMLTILPEMKENSIDTCVTDPPYGLEFMGKKWDAPWQVSSKSALFGKRERAIPGWGTTRNPTCQVCHGRLRGAKRCSCNSPTWDEAPSATHIRQMRAYQEWVTMWATELFRVLKPGGMLLAFGGTRTHHRLMCGIEDAGFEIRDCLMWLYGTGFPKSHDISKGIDKAAKAKREVIGVNPNSIGRTISMRGGRLVGSCDKSDRSSEVITTPATDEAKLWNGWGTALKPSYEPIILAMKPLDGTFAQNALKHGVAGLNIDGCRIGLSDNEPYDIKKKCRPNTAGADIESVAYRPGRIANVNVSNKGRWPANVVLDEEAGKLLDEQTRILDKCGASTSRGPSKMWAKLEGGGQIKTYTDRGGASRFFYQAKASKKERTAGGKVTNPHPTVKPISLMRWLVRLTSTPTDGVVLDPFAGSGTTGVACLMEGRSFIGIEIEEESAKTARARLNATPQITPPEEQEEDSDTDDTQTEQEQPPSSSPQDLAPENSQQELFGDEPD